MPVFWFAVWAFLVFCASMGVGGLIGMVAKPSGGRYFDQDRSSLIVGIVVSCLCGIAFGGRALYHRRKGALRLRASIPMFDRMPPAVRTSVLAGTGLVCLLTATLGPTLGGSSPTGQTPQDGSDLATTAGIECVLGIIVLFCGYRLYRRLRPGAPQVEGAPGR
jgi:hypothetical protein